MHKKIFLLVALWGLFPAHAKAQPSEKVPTGSGASVKEVRSLRDMSINDILNTAPNDLGETRRPLGPERRDPEMTTEARRKRHIDALTGGVGILLRPQADTSIDLTVEQERATNAVNAEHFRKQYNGLQRFGAAVDQAWLSSSIARSWDDAHHTADPAWQAHKMKNWQAISDDSENQDEFDERMATNSIEEYTAVQARQGHTREMQQIIAGSPHRTALMLGTALLDPLGWVVAALAFFALRPAWSQFRLGQQLRQLTNIYQAIEETRFTHFIGAGGGIDSLPIEDQARAVQTITRVSQALRAHPRHVITRELLKNELLAERMGRSIRIAGIERLLNYLIDEGVAMNMDDFAKSYL